MVFAVRKKRRQDSSTVAYERDENSQFELAMDTKLEMNMDEEYNQLIGHHPNIVNIIGFRRVGLCWEQFVEYIDGENFYNYMDALYFKTNRLIEGDKARSFFTNLMNAVEHIHSLKLAHMDIKLEHCLITRNGILKLSNFAEARIFVPNLKFAFPEYFTKAYAAPETLKKKYRPDVADIWACGIFLYVMLKKCFPWDIARKNEDRNYRRWVKNDDKIAFLSIPGCYGCVSGRFLLNKKLIFLTKVVGAVLTR
ncbi:unnamed protein product [Thelazia callipaeda]|uniref:non-specific serine/threonine protein kinase n=1 Tax=Thelazia callipaeda TaxID=103827 RepID=A0A0N5CRI3_THECL|nr:unnamed protein product [Thelazia callipaeda]